MSFSRRVGIVPEKEIQIQSMDSVLRNKLYNLFTRELENFYCENEICSRIMNNLGEIIYNSETDKKVLFRRFQNQNDEYPWYDVYDIMDFFLQEIMSIPDDIFEKLFYTDRFSGVIDKNRYLSLLSDLVNQVLEEEKSGYRIINNEICPITNEEEITAVTHAASNSFDTVRTHIQKALSLYSNRQNPDYENSIKESITAVESLCSIITGVTGSQATLGKTIKHLKDNGIIIHSAMEEGFKKLYGYTSDADGIRHGGIDFTNAPSEDALYMLISCSAFINYLTAKYNEINK